MLNKIAFHIQKGGVGKSTLSGNVAYSISKTKKTIMLDCDPQGNLSSWFITDKNLQYELSDILKGNVPLKDVIYQITDNLFIIPTFGLNGSLKNYAETQLNDEPFIFEDLCVEIEKLGFEFAIFDLSPGMSKLEKCVLLAMDETITPLTPEFFSIDGIVIFNNELQKINKAYRKNVVHNKIVVNNINYSFRRHNIIYDKIKKLDYQIFTIGQDSKIAEAQLQNKSIYEYYPESKTIPELNNLAESLIKTTKEEIICH
ncbi:MAG: ParA family protein [Spirochaetes bacterium]|nr:ParA family protein [Spirochaetota bacterium]